MCDDLMYDNNEEKKNHYKNLFSCLEVIVMV